MILTRKHKHAERLDDLEERIAALQRAASPQEPLWKPFPNSPQEAAYLSTANEILYGGSAGSGKSSLAVGMALTKHHRSLLLRRQATQAVELVSQLRRFAGSRGRWKSVGHGGVLTTDDGRVIEVSGCEYEDDWMRFQGRPHDLLAFDEASAFTRDTVVKLSAWVRHENPQQLCQILFPTNPPTDAAGRWLSLETFAPWLSPDFPNPARPGEVRYYIFADGETKWVDGQDPVEHKGEMVKPKSRVFFPAKLSDNPILSATDYGSRLQALPEPLRSQLLYGDFTIREMDSEWQLIPTEWVRKAQARWKPERPAGHPQTVLGVDPARGGADRMAICRRYGTWIDQIRTIPGVEVPDGQTAVKHVIRAHENDAEIRIDGAGIGASVYDLMKQQSWLKVRSLNAADGKIIRHLRDRSRKLSFTNLRAALWWVGLRESLDPECGIGLALPPDAELLAELTAPSWKIGTAGITVESKDDIRKRLGRSTDKADALAMAMFSPYAPPQGLRVVPLAYKAIPGPGPNKPKGGRSILACSNADAAALGPIEEHSLLIINLHTEPGDMGNLDTIATPVLARIHLNVRDIEPGDYASRWGQPIPKFGGLTPQGAMVSPETAKLFCREIFKERDRRWEALLVVDDTDGRRALSAAVAAADLVRLPHAFIWFPDRPEGVEKIDPPNAHVCAVLKSGRV
jgi:hypothetical protein